MFQECFVARVPDAVRRVVPLRRAGTYFTQLSWTPDQQCTTPQVQRVASHPGNEPQPFKTAAGVFPQMP